MTFILLFSHKASIVLIHIRQASFLGFITVSFLPCLVSDYMWDFSTQIGSSKLVLIGGGRQ